MLNMDFSQDVVIDTGELVWQDSPMRGVLRKPLAREDAERGHATSLVRYQAGSVFRPHPHPLGEEILVLEGVFSDEHGDYPAGTYFRNPPGSSHAPKSENGCLLLVKLHQFQHSDSNQIRVDARHYLSQPTAGYFPLYQWQLENVFLLNAVRGEAYLANERGPFECYVLEGCVQVGDRLLQQGAWFRTADLPAEGLTTDQSALLWCKTGHFSG